MVTVIDEDQTTHVDSSNCPSAADVAKTAALIVAAQYHEEYPACSGLTIVSATGVRTSAVDRCDELRPFSCEVHQGRQPQGRCAVCTLSHDMKSDRTHAWFCEVILDSSGTASNVHIWKVPMDQCCEALRVAREFETA